MGNDDMDDDAYERVINLHAWAQERRDERAEDAKLPYWKRAAVQRAAEAERVASRVATAALYVRLDAKNGLTLRSGAAKMVASRQRANPHVAPVAMVYIPAYAIPFCPQMPVAGEFVGE